MKKIVLVLLGLAFSFAIFAQRYSGRDHVTPAEKLSDEYCTGVFKMYDGLILDLANENGSARGYLNILNWLEGRVAGLQVYYTRDRTPVPFIRNMKASIFVDEIQVDPTFLNDLPVTDIGIVKIIREPFVGAIGNGSGGVIAIYTNKGDGADDDQVD